MTREETYLKSDAGRTDREKQIEDLRKAVWYIEDEIKLLGGTHADG